MTCNDCREIWEDDLTDSGSGRQVITGVELCPVHSLTEKLAEALRNSRYALSAKEEELLAKYDSAKAQSGERV